MIAEYAAALRDRVLLPVLREAIGLLDPDPPAPVARAAWDAETGDGLADAAERDGEPPLNGTELAAVRELIEERFGSALT